MSKVVAIDPFITLGRLEESLDRVLARVLSQQTEPKDEALLAQTLQAKEVLIDHTRAMYADLRRRTQQQFEDSLAMVGARKAKEE